MVAACVFLRNGESKSPSTRCRSSNFGRSCFSSSATSVLPEKYMKKHIDVSLDRRGYLRGKRKGSAHKGFCKNLFY